MEVIIPGSTNPKNMQGINIQKEKQAIITMSNERIASALVGRAKRHDGTDVLKIYGHHLAFSKLATPLQEAAIDAIRCIEAFLASRAKDQASFTYLPKNEEVSVKKGLAWKVVLKIQLPDKNSQQDKIEIYCRKEIFTEYADIKDV